jgi:hypothetical protein
LTGGYIPKAAGQLFFLQLNTPAHSNWGQLIEEYRFFDLGQSFHKKVVIL